MASSYHLIINLTKKEFLDPSRFHGTRELCRFIREGGGVHTGLALLLSKELPILKYPGKAGDLQGRWAGDSIAMIGSYIEDPSWALPYLECENGQYLDLTEVVRRALEDITPPSTSEAAKTKTLEAEGTSHSDEPA